MFELGFHIDVIDRKHKLVPIGIIKNNSEGVVEKLIKKNLYDLIKTLHVFLGKKDSTYICRRCLSSYTIENGLLKHEQSRDQQKRASIRTSNDSRR